MNRPSDLSWRDLEDWRRECKRYFGRVLTGEKWHYCPTWDYLPIDETCKEFDACACFKGRQ